MIDLSTTYLGLKLKNPLVASASPLSKKLDSAKKLEEAGISAIVMYSLFEEQIIHESLELDHYLTRGTDSFAEAMSYLPNNGTYSIGPEKYLSQVTSLKKNLSIPVIGSLNGVSKGGWTRSAKQIQDAGADALELNLYYIPTDTNLTAQELENAQVELVAEVKSVISIPLAVKLSPYITALPNFARRIVEAGANGLVLFNRFYQPDFDLNELEIVHNLDLSTSADLRLPLRWISILHGKVNADFALTSGVHTASDVLKSMMSGAKVAMMASNLLHNGEKVIPSMLSELEAWMKEREYVSIEQMQGSMSQKSVKEPAAFERANYMKVLTSFRDLV
ncbi:MAG: dihydroorotate dehydrogenase-like protein [Anaerolineales bacterium]|jgi:dihydroorotate dehydrogenase (fumarate)|uniref:dihydroorotate dehydrogenase-like protein n=1 Tax=Candidatus Villigracilis affinis TaxID=3140682 RepID=UPI001B5A7540|nr:dihydroorotate dehydrogenase-like protein [Anaerolineales bacterium]MBK9602990.1 dihydroorotate dehydrogenase-like protein [Anaerolineales bacterium]MBL0346167.1 dihydroorotate dehydrogenase-like protein [Anaerolineales bacterium]MBP8047904.1 dihydroorotate dehydrogenase-like protein [Anaerolineales bacterium]